MATFREYLERGINLPAVAADTTNVFKDLADTVFTGARLANVALSGLTAQEAAAAQTQQASLDAQQRLVQAQTIDAERKTKEVEAMGLPALIGSLPPEQLDSILKNNPDLSPEAQAAIGNGVAKKYVADDILELQRRVLTDPNRNVSEHLKEISSTRAASINDFRARGTYLLDINDQAQALMGRALLENINREKAIAIDGINSEFLNATAASAATGTLGRDFEGLLDTLVTKLQPLDPNTPPNQLKRQAIDSVFSQLAGPLGQNIGLDTMKVAPQVEEIAGKYGTKYPSLNGLNTYFQSEAAKYKLARANQTRQQLESLFESATNRSQIELLLSQAQEAEASGVIDKATAFALNGKAEAALAKTRLVDDVTKALGVKVNADGSTSGDWINKVDNTALLLGAEHDTAIDLVGSRLGLSGQNLALWQVNNFGRLTESQVDALRAAGEGNDPLSFAEALNTFKAIDTVNKGYTLTLLREDKMSKRLGIAAALVTLGNQDPASVVRLVANLSEADVHLAEGLLDPTNPKTQKELDLSSSQIAGYRDVSRKLGSGGFPSASLQEMYKASFALAGAQYIKEKGVTDLPSIWKTADAVATKFVKNNTSVLTFADKTYAVPNAVRNSWAVSAEVLEGASMLYKRQVQQLAGPAGVSPDAFSADFERMTIDPSDPTRFLLPIRYLDIYSGTVEQGAAVSFPRNANVLKRELNIRNIRTEKPDFGPDTSRPAGATREQ